MLFGLGLAGDTAHTIHGGPRATTNPDIAALAAAGDQNERSRV